MYDTDTLTWSELQAALLRRLAAGERVDEELDWPNLIEEIESAGRSDLHAVESLINQCLVHHLKMLAWPHSSTVPHWRAEFRLFQGQAAERFTESMRQRIRLTRIYKLALRGLPEIMDGQPPLPVPTECPFTLDQLLAGGQVD